MLGHRDHDSDSEGDNQPLLVGQGPRKKQKKAEAPGAGTANASSAAPGSSRPGTAPPPAAPPPAAPPSLASLSLSQLEEQHACVKRCSQELESLLAAKTSLENAVRKNKDRQELYQSKIALLKKTQQKNTQQMRRLRTQISKARAQTAVPLAAIEAEILQRKAAAPPASQSQLLQDKYRLRQDCLSCLCPEQIGYRCAQATCQAQPPVCLACTMQNLRVLTDHGWDEQNAKLLKSEGLMSCFHCYQPYPAQVRQELYLVADSALIWGEAGKNNRESCEGFRTWFLQARNEAAALKPAALNPRVVADRLLLATSTLVCTYMNPDGLGCGNKICDSFLQRAPGGGGFDADTNCLAVKCERCTNSFCAWCGFWPTDLEVSQNFADHGGLVDACHRHLSHDCRFNQGHQDNEGHRAIFLSRPEDRAAYQQHCRARATLLACTVLTKIQEPAVRKEIVGLLQQHKPDLFAGLDPLQPGWACRFRNCRDVRVLEAGQPTFTPYGRTACRICGEAAPSVVSMDIW